jgi:hypothetical protein
MRNWWPRRRSHRTRGRHSLDLSPRRIPDGDTVPVDGFPASWSQRLAWEALNEPTAEYPTVPLVRRYVAPEFRGR